MTKTNPYANELQATFFETAKKLGAINATSFEKVAGVQLTVVKSYMDAATSQLKAFSAIEKPEEFAPYAQSQMSELQAINEKAVKSVTELSDIVTNYAEQVQAVVRDVATKGAKKAA